MPELSSAFYIGNDTCLICHRSTDPHIMNSFHTRLSDGSGSNDTMGCESCHGPGSLHRADPDNNTIIHFDRLLPEERSAVCRRCHENISGYGFLADTHDTHGIDCTRCHTEHAESRAHLLSRPEPGLCFGCHPDIKARCRLPSHHPVVENKMPCSTCHPPHRDLPFFSGSSSVNDLCLDCHTEYQGPFVYEHAPVAEECTICHSPHGSIANNLLRQSEPFLCLRCHRGHKHDPTETHPTAASLLTSCTQCHSMIHGSDLPSQVHRGGLIR